MDVTGAHERSKLNRRDAETPKRTLLVSSPPRRRGSRASDAQSPWIPTGTTTARLDHGYEISYGVRADDPAMRELLQGLYMLASVPYGSVPEDAYIAWQDEAVSHINAGFQGVIDLSAELGYKQSVVNNAITQHEAAIVQINNQVATLEAADPFETALRLSQLQTQLEATFSLTARMSELSLTKFL
jgi:flagellar hook-associated protein 3 FlgL